GTAQPISCGLCAFELDARRTVQTRRSASQSAARRAHYSSPRILRGYGRFKEMKSVRIHFVAAIVSALVLLSVSLSVAQTQQPKSPPKTGQGKSDKSKKPAEQEGNQDDQVVKIGTQLVTVPFNVTDKKNRYINDLSKDDIEVLEDSK